MRCFSRHGPARNGLLHPDREEGALIVVWIFPHGKTQI
jgi:hypothetical protein